jgi:hypothetical protein
MLFCGSVAIEGVHPLQCGIGRRKVRTQRRHGLPRENPLVFYPRRGVEICVNWLRWGWLALTIRMQRRRIEADPDSSRYTDDALQGRDSDRQGRQSISGYARTDGADDYPGHRRHDSPALVTPVAIAPASREHLS